MIIAGYDAILDQSDQQNLYNHLSNYTNVYYYASTLINNIFILRLSPKVPYVDETALEKESNELSEESKELLSIYHKTFDDERVRTK